MVVVMVAGLPWRVTRWMVSEWGLFHRRRQQL